MTAPAEEQLQRACERFYYREAELLDGARFSDWLALIERDIDYRVPVRTTRDNRDGDGFSTKAYFMEEDYGTLKMRVNRLASPYAWAENPRTRTRRMVANIRVGACEGRDLHVTSNLAVFCHRSEASVPLIVTCERRDVLRQRQDQWTLARRLALLDTTVLGLESLSILL